MISWPPFGLKLNAWRSRAWLNRAKGQSCVRCGAQDGTVCSAHYCGQFAQEFGRGKSEKVADFLVADLCARCHAELDGYEAGNDDARTLEFWRCVFRTIHRRLAGDSSSAF